MVGHAWDMGTHDKVTKLSRKSWSIEVNYKNLLSLLSSLEGIVFRDIQDP